MFSIVLIGVGATLVMDLWTLLLKRLGVTTLNYAMLGRWAGHLLRGRVYHQGIAKSAPVAHELAWGWVLHYAIGLLFAAGLVLLAGERWLQAPTPGPALIFGIATVLAPLCVMQPAMGAGLFASRTPTPWRNRARSLLTHAVFGCGLYLSAWAAAHLT
ncbi:DUF2938 domain-containing protein [Pseudomonas sp. 148P]|uniref:DUF2938 domain-containing protein n=1 Tax=Pseudomonas ulcerans TaxID=3115852 RepID=A0ABU7HP32_9PSED|nr:MULTISPECIES: DUF2938 domain-containing protein [unclassified Pseudomonas]MEE1920514.1 DUF2938 domain-containing protein [Pseudomonas sp. 147P]MEE1933296.1 DUF2938 domain-containing protein [Pseudomonas sp. 148P]